MTHRLLLLSEEPVIHGLLYHRLKDIFELSGNPGTHADALTAARNADVHVMLVDTDLREADPIEVVAGLVLVCPAPLVALSSVAAPGSPAAAALFLAGAQVVLHKPAGRLPLDLDGSYGDVIVGTLRQVAGA